MQIYLMVVPLAIIFIEFLKMVKLQLITVKIFEAHQNVISKVISVTNNPNNSYDSWDLV